MVTQADIDRAYANNSPAEAAKIVEGIAAATDAWNNATTTSEKAVAHAEADRLRGITTNSNGTTPGAGASGTGGNTYVYLNSSDKGKLSTAQKLNPDKSSSNVTSLAVLVSTPEVELLAYDNQNTIARNSYRQRSNIDSSIQHGEYIVVSGGKFKSGSGYQYEFVDSALKQIELLIASGVDPNDIMWLFASIGWSDQELLYIHDAAVELKIKYHGFTEITNLTEYINTGGKDERNSHKIVGFYVFSHGYPGNGGSIEFGHGHTGAANFSWIKSDLDDLNSKAFDNTLSFFYSCNSATAHENSFACLWSKITDGKVMAAHGQTTYKKINSWQAVDHFERTKWKERRGSYEKPGASFRLPTISSAAHWDMFISGRQGK